MIIRIKPKANIYTTYKLIYIVNTRITAKNNQCFVTNQIGDVLRSFRITFSALVKLLCVHYASTYSGLSSGSKCNCQNWILFNSPTSRVKSTKTVDIITAHWTVSRHTI